jgi:spermidine synthase
MPVLFDELKQGKRYKVVQAGNSVRLYTDGVFHSQYNPSHIVSGAVWDLLLLPCFCLAPHQRQSLLLLGVGGGAVLRMLAHFFADLKLTGVDIDRQCLQLAKRYFGVSGKNFQLIAADAKAWVESQPKKNQFDIVIDDLYGGQNGDPQRPFPIEATWLANMCERLTNHGLLVINFDRPSAAREFIKTHSDQLRDLGFVSHFKLVCPGYENTIIALVRQKVTRAALLNQLDAQPLLDTSKQSCRLNVKLTQLQ